jgi:hypothetical protein
MKYVWEERTNVHVVLRENTKAMKPPERPEGKSRGYY